MMETKKFITRLMYGSIALAGVIAASVILFAQSSDAVGNSFITALIILLTDAFILLGLVARHEILKIALWLSSVYSMIVAIIYNWLPRPDNYYYNGYNGYGYEKSSQIDTIEIFSNLTFGAYVLTFGLGMLAVFSLFSKAIDGNKKILETEEKASDNFYKLSIAFALFSTIIFAIAASFDVKGFILRIGFATLMIAMTTALIMVISVVTSSIKASAKKVINYGPMINGGSGNGRSYNQEFNYGHPSDYNNNASHFNNHPNNTGLSEPTRSEVNNTVVESKKDNTEVLEQDSSEGEKVSESMRNENFENNAAIDSERKEENIPKDLDVNNSYSSEESIRDLEEEYGKREI